MENMNYMYIDIKEVLQNLQKKMKFQYIQLQLEEVL